MASGFPVALKDDPADTATVPTVSKEDFQQAFFMAYENRPIPVFWQNLARKKKMTHALDAIYSLYSEIAQEVQSEFRNNKKQDYRLAKLRPGHMGLMVALTEGSDEKDLTKQKLKRRLKNAMRLTLRSSIPQSETDEHIDSVIHTTMMNRMDELLDEKRRGRAEDKKRRAGDVVDVTGVGDYEEPAKKRRDIIDDYASQANLARQMLLLARETESFSQDKIKEMDDRATEFLNAYFAALTDGASSMLKFTTPDAADAGMIQSQAAAQAAAMKSGAPAAAAMNNVGHAAASAAIDMSSALPMQYGMQMASFGRPFGQPMVDLSSRSAMNPNKPNGK